MIFEETEIKGLYVISFNPQTDQRGYFSRIFCMEEFKKVGEKIQVVQISKSMTRQIGTIRGLHFQRDPYAERKIVQCTKGSVYDVAVDLRKGSDTLGKWISLKLSENSHKLFYIPKGFAHGFQTLSDNCEMEYFITEFFSPEYASGVRWDDPVLDIKWPIKNPVLSEKDKGLPFFDYEKSL